MPQRPEDFYDGTGSYPGEYDDDRPSLADLHDDPGHPYGIKSEDSARHPYVDELGPEHKTPEFDRPYYPDTGYEPGPGEEAWFEDQDDLADRDQESNWGPPPGDHDFEPPEGPEVDDWPDPDHGREDHRVGSVLRQSEQWPHRVAVSNPTVGDGIHLMRGEDTGLYGEDEDHPYDVYGMANEHGGYDVVGYPTAHPKKKH